MLAWPRLGTAGQGHRQGSRPSGAAKGTLMPLGQLAKVPSSHRDSDRSPTPGRGPWIGADMVSAGTAGVGAISSGSALLGPPSFLGKPPPNSGTGGTPCLGVGQVLCWAPSLPLLGGPGHLVPLRLLPHRPQASRGVSSCHHLAGHLTATPPGAPGQWHETRVRETGKPPPVARQGAAPGRP